MFTKDNLKVGYVVKWRNGEFKMVLPAKEGMVLSSNDGWERLKSYNNDLTIGNYKKYDIVSVFGLQDSGYKACEVSPSGRPLLWERKEEPIEITIEEIAKLKGVSPDRIRIKE